MKTNIYIEFEENKVNTKSIIDTFKEQWKNDGKKVKDIKEVDIYFKPKENICYYVIDKNTNGKFSI